MISYSENESYFVAVTAFCARITKALMDAAEFKIEETRPKFGQKVFSTVTEADRWLSENSLIEVTEMKVPTRTAFGILGSHSVAESITLEYIEHNQPTGYQYGMVEFEKASVYALNILAQREFKSLFSKSTTEERKILCLMAESDKTILSYSYIKENANLNSEPSALLKNLVNKNMIIKPSRGKYKLKNNLFKLYLQNLRINQETGLIN